MPSQRKMTRNVQIGLSRSDKAKVLSSKGFYGEALAELQTALASFKKENKGGAWDATISGLYNNLGLVHIFLQNYTEAEVAFLNAKEIKERIDDKRSLSGTLIGLSDAYRCLCRFDEAHACLEEAMDISLDLKDDHLSHLITASIDVVERSRNNMPSAGYVPVDFDELYLSRQVSRLSLAVDRVTIEASKSGLVKVSVAMGFPELQKDVEGLEGKKKAPLLPCMAVLFPDSVEGNVTGFEAVNEEEHAVQSSIDPFNGIIYSPDSYHRCGPLPLPSCKRFIYTCGIGYIFKWKVAANGWYQADLKLDVKDAEAGFKLDIVLPFGTVRVKEIVIKAKKPLEYGITKVKAGNFYKSRELVASPSKVKFTTEETLYEDSLSGKDSVRPGVKLQYGVLSFDFRQ
jgi:tetratricopeptide (TPR) repeat protein